ncbi:NAD(P)/FAD-dependent oxidoreductase [Synechococcus sp. HK05]|uniref:NAD(P)/FAD-dependent oxidoreductase n=1 Tax=Synechococcus sp. HK05 TaxID=2725975 RepID=UPI001C387C8B|nr:NAD(P)/FAD-dependent oxidoreductase [Synechococcus sp. HK05]
MSDQQTFEVLIAGAGPAGLLLARRLAQAGVCVAVVDPLLDLHQAAFSSAALPLSAVKEFQLPAQVQAARWHGWQLHGPGDQQRQWMADHDLGAVLDFGGLRQWLADQATAAGAHLQLGWAVRGWCSAASGAIANLRGPGGQERSVACRWLVDATGQRRALLGDPPAESGALVAGSGVEWLLQLPLPQWNQWSERLSFMLGRAWVPQGYGWVFPMQPGQLKLGVCRLHDASRRQPPLHQLLSQLQLRLHLADAPVLDRHGGLIRSTIRRREPHQRGPLLGLGDAVSTGNLLGGEGIRHAMASSEVLAPLLLQALGGRPDALRRYPLQLRRRLGWRWSLSGRLARRTWLGLNSSAGDQRLERLLEGLQQKSSAEELSALLFHYRFERYGWKALPYLLGWR